MGFPSKRKRVWVIEDYRADPRHQINLGWVKTPNPYLGFTAPGLPTNLYMASSITACIDAIGAVRARFPRFQFRIRQAQSGEEVW